MPQTLPAGAGPSHPGAGPLQTIRFPVTGMTCGACVVHITRAVKPLAGVDRVKVDLGNELVTVRRDPELVSDDMIAAAIVEAGYQPALAAAQVVTGSDGRGFLERWFRR